MSEATARVRESYRRCASDGLIETFYQIFLASDPAIRPLFAKTDFKEQHELLRSGIHLAIFYAEGNPVGVNALHRLHQTHGASKMNIPKRLYPFWKESFLKAIGKTDPKFDESLRKDWDTVLQKAIDCISAGAA